MLPRSPRIVDLEQETNIRDVIPAMRKGKLFLREKVLDFAMSVWTNL
jgi:hypothetical protein